MFMLNKISESESESIWTVVCNKGFIIVIMNLLGYLVQYPGRVELQLAQGFSCWL